MSEHLTSKGRFGAHGGQYVPEGLMGALAELEQAYDFYKNDKDFQAELADLFKNYTGRPSLLYHAKKMSEDLGGAKIYLKREDLNHTGAHKINNVLGQALLAKTHGKNPPAWPRPVRDSTAWQRPRRRHSSTWSATSSWARKTRAARR